MATKLFQIVQWADKEGPVKTVAQMRMKLLPETMKEQVYLAKVDESSDCTPALLAKIRTVAAAIVGKPCPV